MDMGNLFFGIVVLIIAVNIYKQTKKFRENASSGQIQGKQPGWKGALDMILEEARRQMEKQAGHGAAESPFSRPSGWEAILPAPGSASDAWPLEDLAPPEIIQPETQQPETSKEVPILQAAAFMPVTGFPAFSYEKEEKMAGDSGCGTPHALSMEALKNAVIWAEILAPPLGLRNME